MKGREKKGVEGKGSNKTARKRSAQRGTQGKNVNYESRRKKGKQQGMKWAEMSKWHKGRDEGWRGGG